MLHGWWQRRNKILGLKPERLKEEEKRKPADEVWKMAEVGQSPGGFAGDHR